jgi:hypothetical protein
VVSIALFLLVTVLASAAESSITVAWDANADPEVIGYRIFVGTAAGDYSETYDVGRQTSFTFPGSPNVRYYFAIAAVATGGVVGPKSSEVAAFDDGPAYVTSQGSGRTSSARDAETTVCAGGADCFVATVRASGLGSITALTPTPDGRVLFIEDRQRIRVLTPAGLERDIALESRHALSGLALDPLFAETGEIFVGESESLRDGSDGLSIVRYRERAGQLRDGARVTTGLRLARGAGATFTLDAARHLYVALPALAAPGSRGADPYEGHVLRLNHDGSLPADARGASPLFAVAVSDPTALAWVAADAQLWQAGADENRSPLVARVGTVPARAGDGLLDPQAVRVDFPGPSSEAPERIVSMAVQGASMFLITESGALYRGALGPGGLSGLQQVSTARYGVPVAVATASDGIYIAIRTTGPSGASTFGIISLTRQRR